MPNASPTSEVPRVNAPRPFVRACGVFLVGVLGTLAVSGCGAMRSYRAEMDETLKRAAEGNVQGAIKVLDRNNSSDTKDLLYFMELGELRRLGGDYAGSFAALSSADAEIKAWEEAARLDPTRAVGQAASFVVNDRVRTYEGYDYEKVMVTTRMAMDHLARGDWDNARVEIKRTHEREALIAEIRAREFAKVEEESRKRGVNPGFQEINGYPVQTVDTPEALSLRNGYQNALSHYLAGFVYEALGETGLSAPGYRKAIELRPGQPLLEQSLGELDARASAADDTSTDMLVVVETGAIPGRVSQSFNLPIPILSYGTSVIMSVSFPILPPAPPGYQAPDILVDRNDNLPTALVLDLDAMARRALKDEMPGIMLRAVVRTTSKAVAQYQMERQMDEMRRKGQDNGGLALALLALQIGGMVVEQADERGWRTLPAQVAVARGRLPRGEHTLDIRSDSGSTSIKVNLSGRHALVSVRLLRGQAFSTPSTSPGGTSQEPPQTRAGTDGQATGEPLYARVETVNFPNPKPSSRRTLQ